MAAMAQQDCGQCGYVCDDYADALFAEEREAAEPLRARRQGNSADAEGAVRRRSEAAASGESKAPAASSAAAEQRLHRRRPGARARIRSLAAFLGAPRLNKRGLEKETLARRVRPQGERVSTIAVGDAFGVFPTNDPALVDAVIAALERAARLPIGDSDAARGAARRARAGARAGRAVRALFLRHRRRAAAEGEARSAAGDDPDGDLSTARRTGRAAQVSRRAARSPKRSSRRSSRCSRGSTRSRRRPRPSPAGSTSRSTPCATASTAASAWASPPPSSPIASGRASSFRSTSSAPMASPCRPIRRRRSSWSAPAPASLLSAPSCTNAGRPARPARHWLFFGHQRRACDFFYEDEFTAMQAAGMLTRLSLAFSRDRPKRSMSRTACAKTATTLPWLEEGAHSTSAATPSAWPPMSSERSSRSSPDIGGRAKRGEGIRRGARQDRALPRRTSTDVGRVERDRAGGRRTHHLSLLRRRLRRHRCRDGNGAWRVKGDPQHPANFGRLCSKGSALAETLSLEGRLPYPMIGGAARLRTGTKRSMSSPTASDG